MRYDKLVYFVTESEPVRLPNGDYSEPSTIKTPHYANVSDIGDEAKSFLFGSITEQGIIMRFQNIVTVDFSYIEFNNKKWKVLRSKTFRRDSALYCGEFNG